MLLRRSLFITIVVIALMVALSSRGVDIGPLLAGAGVVGLAIGFGAQRLVRDIISGVFFLMDDAFRIGEYIDVGAAKGTVERINVRLLVLRHHLGPLNTVQMYLNVDEGLSREVLQRARPAGFKAVILTVDAIGQGSSDEYVRLGRNRPWLPYGDFPERTANLLKTDLSWADLEFTANASGLPGIVKGLARAEDAVAAAKAGAAAIRVSNHGGRALDGTLASMTVLPEIVEGDVPIILDSGIRRRTDVAKSLALGADAVAVGRPVWWSLALGGAGLIDYFRRELVDAMLHLGVRARRSGTSTYGASARECGDVPHRASGRRYGNEGPGEPSRVASAADGARTPGGAARRGAQATFPASDPIAVGHEFLEVLEQQPDRRVARAGAEGGEGAGRCETPS